MNCCICGQHMAGLPAMQDRETGVVYCSNHSDHFHVLKDPQAFSSCTRCGFKFSPTYSHFPSDLCPSCGSALKQAAPDPAMQQRLTQLLQILRVPNQKRAELQSIVGYPGAVDDLIYLLENEPDPGDQIGFGLRDNIVNALSELSDVRSIGPLTNCYLAYLAFEESLLDGWKERGLSVPESYDQIADLIEKYGVPPSDTAAAQRYHAAIAGTVIAKIPDSHRLQLPALAWVVRMNVVRALGCINSTEVNSILSEILNREHDKKVREEITLELCKRGDPQGIPGLVVYLDDICTASSWVSGTVTNALGFLGSFSETHDEAFEAIVRFYEQCDGKEELRAHALEILKKLTSHRPTVEKIMRKVQWRAEGRCELCGVKLGFMDRLRKIVRCKEHQSTV